MLTSSRLRILRCIGAIGSGRHFLQTTEEIHDDPFRLILNHSSQQGVPPCLTLSKNKAISFTVRHWYHKALDYLRQFHELDAYTVEAADGHFIDHACHTEKGSNGKVYAAEFIYTLNLRDGLL